MLNYANKMTSNVVALNIAPDKRKASRIERKWREYEIDDPLVVIINPYRDIIHPVEDFLEEQESNMQSGDQLVVVLTKFVVKHWYDALLHNQTTYLLSRVLQQHRNVSIALVPYHYDDR
jgi:hypothetical protein